ncbi:hypothetical protein [Sorangium sp. So ce233]|uniref:hypothetical protein n=1 Tax=Sorangium sp. So ce233 TaxID=3133290 RepID=UPI003F5F41D8
MDTTEIETRAWEVLTEIAAEVPRYGGRLEAFACSVDWIDRAWPEALRRRAAELAQLVAPAPDELVERACLALAFACAGDSYAEREIAGRFRSGVRRLRVLDALERHPKRSRHGALVRALERGRFTAEQWKLAQRLANEAPAAPVGAP